MRHHVLFIISAAQRAAANVAAQTFDPAGGGRTFSVGLNASGLPADAPTHYWAAANVSQATFDALPALAASFPGAFIGEYDPGAQADFPNTRLVELGLKRISPA